jgi:hypothetical protein
MINQIGSTRFVLEVTTEGTKFRTEWSFGFNDDNRANVDAFPLNLFMALPFAGELE